MAENVCILLIFEFFWAALSLILVIDQFRKETLAAAQLSILLNDSLIVRATIN